MIDPAHIAGAPGELVPVTEIPFNADATTRFAKARTCTGREWCCLSAWPVTRPLKRRP